MTPRAGPPLSLGSFATAFALAAFLMAGTLQLV